MRIKRFLRDKWYYIATQLFVACFLLGNMVLFRCNSYIIYLTIIGSGIVILVPVAIEYGKKHAFYKEMEKCRESLDKKYLICELLPKPAFLEGEIVYEGLNNINQNMMDELRIYKKDIKEYKEYIDLWVHEIKTPVTNVLLITENHPDEVTDSIREEMEKIEGYIEQTLYYSKTNVVEKDYAISKRALREIVQTAIKQNKKALITNHIQVELRDLDTEVMTDGKWLVFVLNQIITNCVKYRKKKGAKICFQAIESEQSVKLFITDNGIGIKDEEVAKVLQKGFVGTNGRKREATTGMGLYICSRLLTKMHHGISVTSKEGSYTTVAITFPETSFYFTH